jgi:hypothetical protein
LPCARKKKPKPGGLPATQSAPPLPVPLSLHARDWFAATSSAILSLCVFDSQSERAPLCHIGRQAALSQSLFLSAPQNSSSYLLFLLPSCCAAVVKARACTARKAHTGSLTSTLCFVKKSLPCFPVPFLRLPNPFHHLLRHHASSSPVSASYWRGRLLLPQMGHLGPQIPHTLCIYSTHTYTPYHRRTTTLHRQPV